MLSPGVLAGIGLVVMAGVVAVGYTRTQRTFSVTLASQSDVKVSGPLRVDFSQDVAAGFRESIAPKVDGTWKQERTVLGVSAVEFTPAKRFEAGRTYRLTIAGVKRAVTGRPLGGFNGEFTAQLPSGVAKTSPAAGAMDVAVKPRLGLTLSDANQGVRELKASLLPDVALRLVSSDDRNFVWEPVTPLKQGTNYTFAVADLHAAEGKQTLFSNSFTTVRPPAVMSARAGGHLAPGQTIDIVFGDAMEQTDKAFTFGLAGTGAWTDDHTYRFSPAESALKPGTQYTYALNIGAKSKKGGVLEGTQYYGVATNGAVAAGFSPGGGDVALNVPIKVAFDQAVDHASAQSKFSLSPAVAGGFSWDGNTMIYKPAGLAYQTTYAVKVAAGVKPVWGLPNGAVLSGSLATVAETIKLGVPAYKTQYKMSCELASSRMVLGFYGINVQDWDVLMKLHYNPRPRDTATNTWDNPNEMYVGDVGGNANTTSYGVHAGPIATAIQSYGRGATASYNVSANYIAQAIHDGHPVIFWGHSTPAKPDAWNTSSGVVQTWLSSHARVVYGVVGRADAPIGFHIIESSKGTTMYWTTAQLMANMNIIPGVSNQTVVVY